MASANFRKAYYSSLGVQVVEVKPSLETALQGDILDIERLNKLCLWVRIPHSYRPLVWKVLLGTNSVAKEVWPFVDRQREEQFDDLKRCVHVLLQQRLLPPQRRGERNIPLRGSNSGDDLTAETMVYMLLIQLGNGRSQRQLAQTLSSPALPPHLSHLRALANTMLEVCDTSESDAYWLFESFVRRYNVSVSDAPHTGLQPPPPPLLLQQQHKQQNHHPQHPTSGADRISTEIGAMQNLLRTHNAPLLAHILSFGQGLDAYCYSWFRTYFASVVPPHCLEGIWDIFIGGAPGILSYLGLSLLLACKRKIEAVRSRNDLVKLFDQVERVVDMDAVANTAIDLWERPVLEGMTKDLRKALGYNF
ncbi:TBC1 domain member 7 [Geranomyces michiganensis]|nr:TBC1 domain member 7 [Geranomyces michiganensis]